MERDRIQKNSKNLKWEKEKKAKRERAILWLESQFKKCVYVIIDLLFALLLLK